MTEKLDDLKTWTQQIDDVMHEIVREAAICDVKLLDPGVIEAILQNNDSVCGRENPRAFKKLRDMLMLGFIMRDKVYEKLGPVETDELVGAIRDKLRQRMGGRLGGNAAS
ncbi:hypothetical protein VAR608DRAFT_2327 [Variovorax sp. HW608]|uniref:hypothetical protein n=1 Tax=Variovorax sp. HW608 TaxID=1034889 RepID=UPI00081F7D8A|nr:hypothetical protein [Variovorax sp. HW608]SCK28080.1 hypothetical protein VAR608DRAFT_2327 [Variovorax sp. HW608]